MGLNISVHGRVICTLIDAETLEVVSRTVYDNIQTNFSKNALGQWITGTSTQSIPPPNSIQLGNGSGTPAVTDTALFAPVAGTLKACDTISTVQTYYAQFVKTYQTTDPSGQFTEAGLLDGTGNLWGHVNINQYKSNQQLLTIQWQVYFTYDSTIQSSILTSYALSALAKWMAGTANVGTGAVVPPNQIILGSGSGTPSINDTALFSPVSATLKTCDMLQYNNQNQTAYFAKSYGQNDATGTFTEMGLQDSNGNLWSHSLLNPNPTRSGTNVLSAQAALNFTAA